MAIFGISNRLLEGNALAPCDSDLIVQTGLLPVGERVPDGWRVLSGNLNTSTVARVAFRFEAEADSA